jgi:hypothetical protein
MVIVASAKIAPDYRKYLARHSIGNARAKDRDKNGPALTP